MKIHFETAPPVRWRPIGLADTGPRTEFGSMARRSQNPASCVIPEIP